MNLELLEHELTLLDGKPVILVEPHFGRVSVAYTGNLQVTRSAEKLVGFHLTTPLQEAAFIFFAEDVARLDPPPNRDIVRIIRLKGPNQYAENYQTTH